jgi:hypothetical protein
VKDVPDLARFPPNRAQARSLGRLSPDRRPFFFSRAAAPKCGGVLYLILKALISGALVAAISEVARRYPGWGGLLASLPLTSLLAMVWLYRDSGDTERVAALAGSTFWFVLPSLPMFLVLPVLLRSGVGFWIALAAVVVATLALYAAFFWGAPKLGIKL